MQVYLIKVRPARSNFEAFSIKQIPRNQNSHADSLVMLATSLGLGLPRVIIIKYMVVPSHGAMATDPRLEYIAYKSVRAAWTY